MFGLDLGLTILLFFCLLAACAFEFINGFHDTANAVATVIYTHSLKPRIAVIWSGFWNFIGVYVGGIAVAMGIVNLLPTEALVDNNIYHGLSMILALIITAIVWNLGTWYFGIPCSSSHTLIGSIFGVGLAYMLMPGGQSIVLNWGKIGDVGLSLLISPVFGFGLAMLLMFLLKSLIKNKKIFTGSSTKKAPPLWIRGILILTCTSVSFSHGSNDGQKGIGLVMIILIGILPIHFALDHSKHPTQLLNNLQAIEKTLRKVDTLSLNKGQITDYKIINQRIDSAKFYLAGINSFKELKGKKPFAVRKDIILISKKTSQLLSANNLKGKKVLSDAELKNYKKHLSSIKSYTEYSPWWVILMISVSLGLGTMIGWRRIVVTIGEKIGKTHLSYAQGASAELIAASTISASTWLGLPVSTTHVLSSGIAGTMVADGGIKNLQITTIKNIGIAWLITIPVTIFLSAVLFLFLRFIFT